MFKMQVGVLKDPDSKKVYKPGDTLPDNFVKKYEKAIEAGVKAGSIVERKSAKAVKVEK